MLVNSIDCLNKEGYVMSTYIIVGFAAFVYGQLLNGKTVR